MNFLSHYYFDRKNNNSYEVLGTVLPDLIKNANKHWNIYPEKENINIFKDKEHLALLKGWKRHLEVDKIFHNTDFFFHHQHQLKLEFKEILKNTPVKPFFLGHIGIELILDKFLINKKLILVDHFYQHLENVDILVLENFLKLNNIQETDVFIKFFENFKKNRYLQSYSETKNISYALKRICMRVWDNPFSEDKEILLTDALNNYILKLKENFIFIFDEIESKLVHD